MKNVIELWQLMFKNIINESFVCIDATIGNGNDSLFLLNQNIKFLYGFDIQEIAINNTNNLLKNNNYNNYQLINDSHEFFNKYINTKVDLIVFNFGYLPKGDKNITTTKNKSYKAIKEGLKLLNKNGFIILVFYPGHQNGLDEAKYIKAKLKKYNQKEYSIIMHNFINQINNPPFLITIQKL